MMSARMKLPSFALFRLKLGTKAVICAAALIAINTAMVLGAGYWSLDNELDTRARSDIEINLRTLTLAFAEVFPDAQVKMADGQVNRVEVNAMPKLTDYALVDRATSYVGGSATIFAYDDASGQFVRRSTNVKKENGDRAVGTALAPDHPGQVLLRRGEAYKGPAVLFGKRFITAYQPIFDKAGKVVGILYVGNPMAPLDAMLSHAVTMMAIAASAGALIVLALTMLIVRGVTSPLKAVAGSLTSLANGDLNAHVGHVDRHDELGEIARTVGVFRDAMLERQRLERQRSDDEHRQVESRKADLNRFVDDFHRDVGGIIGKVLDSSRQFETSAHRMTEATRATADLSEQSADASHHASEHVSNAAAAAEELSKSIEEINRQVHVSNGVAADAVKQAGATDARMIELTRAGDRIGDVLKLITTIAEQTNLLALNATIEAARAGDAGRGFAVVASEVKNLAGQTAKATEEISAHIANMQVATAESVDAIKGIGKTIEQINEISSSIAAAVNEQGAATQEIARSLQQAAASATQIAANAETVAKGANDSGETSQFMLKSASELSTNSSALEAQVARFLAGMKAA